MPLLVSAQANPLDSLGRAGQQAYGTPVATPVRDIIASVVQIILGFLGFLFVILIIIGGFQWMTSGGNEKKIAEAKGRLVSSTIGLTIVLTSYAIARSISEWLSRSV
jgi:hypothetical protein